MSAAHYQGRALERERRRPRPGAGARVARVIACMLAIGVLAMLPWRELRRRYAVVTDIRVHGQHYLEAERIERAAGVRRGQDALSLDYDRARQMLLMDPRIQSAEVRRRGFTGVEIEVVERVPALLVQRGEPWEIDSSGVLLAPLERGVVADVPLLTGADCSRLPAGAQIRTPEVQRGLAWIALLSDNALRLAGQVSEIDVSDPRLTSFVLLDGTRVLAPTWPTDARPLSGLRVALADLERRGMKPRELDVRFRDQVIVRSARPAVGPEAPAPRRS